MSELGPPARRVLALSKHSVRLLLADRVPVVILLGMPLVVMAFLRPTYGAALKGMGYHGENGAGQAVPGTTVVFAFLWIGFLAYTFFLEHHWHTWQRVRASGASTGEIVAGKTLPAYLLILLQVGLLLTIGSIAFGAHVRGSVIGLAAVALTLAACVVALTLVLVSISGSFQQVNAIGSLAAVVLTGLGGALSPPGSLPDGIAQIAPASPAYWAVHGMRRVMLGHGGQLGPTLLDAAALAGFAAAGLAFAVFRLTRKSSLAG